MNMESIIQGYENTKLIKHDDLSPHFPNAVFYDELSERETAGVLKANIYSNEKLMQIYSQVENHVGVIAATRQGKTSSYVIPTIISFAKQKIKRSMIISDPKGELFDRTAVTLWKHGYKVLVINFRDYIHSECWNPLTPIYRKYQSIFKIYDEVELAKTDKGMCYKFREVIYKSRCELDLTIDRLKQIMLEDVGNDIDGMAQMIVPTTNMNDPYWQDSAREVFKGCLWAMLEDSSQDAIKDSKRQLVTEETFSVTTVLTILKNMIDDGDDFSDQGFFSSRNKDSKAYSLVKSCMLDNAKTTRRGVLTSIDTAIAIFKESAIRIITSCNSFDLKEALTSDKPVAIFINYRDELKVHYHIISLFIQDAYRILIEHATGQENGKREVPFYFVLDEFGNFPAIKDFETTISACAGRNIFFILVIQSYAQLSAVYGSAVAAIIRDNLTMHVFFGSNNPGTLEEFSKECGQFTRISPLSALNGKESEIDDYKIETIPLVPQSMLAKLSPGECIITEANCGYVMFSKLERYYLCKELNSLPRADLTSYNCHVNPFDKRYIYTFTKNKRDIFNF